MWLLDANMDVHLAAVLAELGVAFSRRMLKPAPGYQTLSMG